MKAITYSYTSVAADVDGLADNATDATWTLTASSAGDGLAHKITVKGNQATDHSAKTAVITETGPAGAQSETINLPNGTATVTSTLYYFTVTSVVPSATIDTDTVDIGWAAASASQAVSLMASAPISAPSVGVTVTKVSGSPNYTLQTSCDGTLFVDHGDVAGETTSQAGVITVPSAAARLTFSVAGVVTLSLLVPYM